MKHEFGVRRIKAPEGRSETACKDQAEEASNSSKYNVNSCNVQGDMQLHEPCGDCLIVEREYAELEKIRGGGDERARCER